MFKLHDRNPSHFKWISYVKSIFDDTGLSFIWNDQIPIERNVLKNLISSPSRTINLYKNGFRR